MKVFLVRHADADADLPEGLGDDARPLTTRARLAIAGHFQALAPRFGEVQLIVCSPLVRSVQTATLLAVALGHQGPLRVHRSLLPDGPVGSIDALLAEHAGQHVILVGHQPSMGATCAHLLGRPGVPRQFTPGTVVALARSDDAAYTFLFSCSPGQPVVEP